VPGVSEVTTVVPWTDGFLAAGRSFCQIFEGGRWRAVALDDEIYAGLTFEGAAFLSGRKGIYRLSTGEQAKKVFSSHLADNNIYLHVVRGNLYAFSVDHGALIWNRTIFQAANQMDWAKNVSAISIQDCGDGRLFAATTQGLFLLNGEQATPICPNLFPRILSHNLVAAFRFEDQVISAMYYGGVAATSIPRDELDWRVIPDGLGGNPYFAREYQGGLLVGHSSGVAVLHDPRRFSATTLPKGDLLFVAALSDGLRIGSTNGIAFTSEKKPISYREKERVDIVRSLAETPDGKILTGYVGKIDVGGKTIELGGREITAIAVTPTGQIAIMQPHGVSLLKNQETPELLPLDALPSSLVASEDGFVVGTAEGAVGLSETGAIQTPFGHGMTKVFAAGGQTLAVDAEGDIFLGHGNWFGRMPPGEAVGAVEWRGQIYVLTHLNDGTD